MGKTLTNKKFISKAKKVHGNKYDYSKVIYISSRKKVIIICPKHGEFLQSPSEHLSGRECRKCSYENRNKTKKSNEKFIEEAIVIHGDKYNYSLVDYKNNRTKIIIICPIHGPFKQIPYHHLCGCDCIKCSGTYLYSEKEFIEKCIKKHNEKYNYSKVKYINNKNKIIIICKKHGEFEQNAHAHLSGQGCPKCAKYSKGEILIKGLLESKNIFFEPQKRFNDCRSDKQNHRFPFDFYLSEFNIIIEYDGELHYDSSNYFGGEKKLKQTQTNDQIKTDYCKTNNIPLLRIPYWDFDNIETIITEFLSNHSPVPQQQEQNPLLIQQKIS